MWDEAFSWCHPVGKRVINGRLGGSARPPARRGRGGNMADSRTPAGVEGLRAGRRGDEVIERLPACFAARRRSSL